MKLNIARDTPRWRKRRGEFLFYLRKEDGEPGEGDEG